MKVLFGRNRKNEYPAHHYPEQSHPYYPPKKNQNNGESVLGFTSDSPSVQPTRGNRDAAESRLTTLEALQIIRLRFEENQRVIYEDQAA